MKAKCIKILSPATGKDLGTKSPWLTVGNIYVVLALTLKFDEITKILVESDENNTPQDFYFNQFELVDDKEPKNWISQIAPNDEVWKAPASWLKEGFWDKLDAGDEQAIVDYFKERVQMF